MQFADRQDAGRALAQKLLAYANREDVLVLGLPRGGIPVAYEVARVLKAPLDLFLVRKLGAPGQEELAMGAIASGGTQVFNEEVVRALQISPAQIRQVVRQEHAELERRASVYRGKQPAPVVKDKTVILVDDGLATGATMRAAVQALRQQQPAQIVVAVPTAAPEICAEFESEVDEIICAMTPWPFRGVGLWYENFEQTTDAEVRQLLADVRRT